MLHSKIFLHKQKYWCYRILVMLYKSSDDLYAKYRRSSDSRNVLFCFCCYSGETEPLQSQYLEDITAQEIVT